MSQKTIAETLGIDLEDEKVFDQAIGTEVVPVEEDIEETEQETVADIIEDGLPDDKDVKDDYEFARQTMRDIITKGRAGLDDLITLTKGTPSARSFEVLSTMIKAISDTNIQLFELQKRKKDIQNNIGQIGNKDSSVQIRQGVVFAGDSVAVLRRAKEKALEKKKED